MFSRLQTSLGLLIAATACGSNGDEQQPAVATSALNVDTDYAGSYLESDPGTRSGCASKNVLSGWCGCPDGSTSYGSARVLHDTFGGIVGGSLRYCAPASVNDFGGVYQVDDPVGGGVGCRMPNAFTGNCSCPAGTTGSPLRTIVDSSAGRIGSRLYYCGKSSPPSSFGGVYQVDDAVSGSRGCRYSNPYTGTCTCPSWAPRDQSFRTIVDGTSGGLIGSTIHACAPAAQWVIPCPGRSIDPTGRVSARLALQACIDANYGGTLALPPGNYLIDDNIGLHVSSGITITTQGTANQGTCLSSSSVRCARLLAGPNLLRDGGILEVTGSNVKLDHIVLDGNRSNRVNSTAWNRCAQSSANNVWGFNARVKNASSVVLTYSASINALCGTGLEWRGTNAIVLRNLFSANGDNATRNMWADGLTLHDSDAGLVALNEFRDNSDIGLIIGGLKNGLVLSNNITQQRQKAFAGFMMDNFGGISPGDFTGALVANNTITCDPWFRCDYGVNLGPHAWYLSGNIVGGKFSTNTIYGGYIAQNVDGAGTSAAPISITGNTHTTGAGSSTFGCFDFTSNFNVSPDSVVNTDEAVHTRRETHGCHD